MMIGNGERDKEKIWTEMEENMCGCVCFFLSNQENMCVYEYNNPISI